MIIIDGLVATHNDGSGISIGAGSNVLISNSKLNANGRSGASVNSQANVQVLNSETIDNGLNGIEISDQLQAIPASVLQDAKQHLPADQSKWDGFLRDRFAPYLGAATQEFVKEFARRVARGELPF